MAVPHGIGNDIHHDLPQIQRITLQRLLFAAYLRGLQLDPAGLGAFLRHDIQLMHRIGKQKCRSAFCFLRRPCIHLVDGQNIIDQLQQIFRGSLSLAPAAFQQRCIGRVAVGDLQHTQNNIDGCADIMAHPAQQLRLAPVCKGLVAGCGFQLFLVFQLGLFLLPYARPGQYKGIELSVFVPVLRDDLVIEPFARDILIIIFHIVVAAQPLPDGLRVQKCEVSLPVLLPNKAHEPIQEALVGRAGCAHLAPFFRVLQYFKAPRPHIHYHRHNVNMTDRSNDLVLSAHFTVVRNDGPVVQRNGQCCGNYIDPKHQKYHAAAACKNLP